MSIIFEREIPTNSKQPLEKQKVGSLGILRKKLLTSTGIEYNLKGKSTVINSLNEELTVGQEPIVNHGYVLKRSPGLLQILGIKIS